MTELTVKSVAVGPWKENCYLLALEQDAWLIDPGDDFEVIQQHLPVSQYNLKGIINTHGHFDHIGAVEDFKQTFGVPFYMHSKDQRLLNQATFYRQIIGDARRVKTPAIDHFLDFVEELQIGSKALEVHPTPGHTAGSVCFVIDDIIFIGDVILDKGHGRTDLPGANQKLLKQSVEYIGQRFKGFTAYPGHGEPFVLNDEVFQKLSSKWD